MKVRIRLDTMTDIAHFVLIASSVPEDVYITNSNRLCVSGKSFLGLAHAREFDAIWCECERDIYSKIEPFVIDEDVENE